MIILLLTALAIFAAMYLCYSRLYRPYYLLPRIIGLTGPKPELIFGNYRQLTKAARNAPKQYDEWYQKYGPNYLLFMGIAPLIVTHDPEMIKDILVRKFDNFVDRSPDGANILKCLLKANKSLATYTGDDWRRLRRTLTPGFSSKKIKLLSPIIETSCKQLTEAIGKLVDKEVSTDVTECFDAFSMEVILTSIFGRVCNLQNGVNDLSKAVNAAFAKTFGHMYGQEMVFTFNSHLSFLIPLMHYLVKKSEIATQWIPVQEIAARLINERKSSGVKRNDMLQYMLDTVEDQDTSTDSQHHKMSMDEILSTAVLIIFSGMGHNLTFLAYLLATNPEVQNKLVENIKSFFENNPDATLHEAAESIEYADMVLRELLRLYPAINLITRYCTETCTTSNGTLIPKGAIVYIPAYNIHHDPKFWPDPEKFDPERFSPDQKATYDSATYLAFGSGPRMCPGQHYSHIKIKMALISMLKKYKFVRADDTDVPLEIDNFFQVTPVRHLRVKVVSV